MADRRHIEACLNELLRPESFEDYGPNGLQVEGRCEVRRVVSGVTASLALIDAAIDAGADALLVHHGLFWRGHDGRLSGWLKQRVARLLGAGLNLFAYHLPLDAHAEFGNNAQLARRMGWAVEGRFGEQDIGFLGCTRGTAGELADRLALELGRLPLLVGDPARAVERIAWCSGGAQSWFEQAIAAGADAYVSGEISEQTTHLARESGVPYIAAGHHATERYGVQALAAHLAQRFGIDCRFVDIDNPA